MRVRLIAAVAAAGLVAAAPALAKPDLDCLWDQLTLEQQASRIPPQPNGDLGPALSDLGPAQLQAMQSRCGLDLDTQAEWLASLDILGAERGIVSWLEHNVGLSPSRLEAAWNGIPAADRTFLLTVSREGILGKATDADNTRADAIADRTAGALGYAQGTSEFNVAATFVKVRSLRLALIEMTPK